MFRCSDPPISPRDFMLVRFKVVFRSLGPAQRLFHRLSRPLALCWMFGAFVKSHHNVSPQSDLNFHGSFRSKQVGGAVQMRAETYAFFFHLAQLAQAEDLEA